MEREIGGGGMSHVFLATEASLNRHVVIKVLPPDMASEVSAARFKREMEVTANLHHPHILPVLSAGARDDIMYYVMPYVEGESLRHRLLRERQLPIPDALRILREIADALAFAHRHGVVHRDIKPENILLEDGHAVLADFGVARALISASSGDGLTGTGMSVGTLGYMAPEQMTGERNIDARADIYSLALVGYEMIAGRAPFAGASAKAVAAAHLMTAPTPLIEERPEVPLRVSNAIARALAKEPDDRFQSAAAFRDEIDNAAAVAMATAEAPRRTTAPLVAVGAAVVVVVAAIGIVFSNRGKAQQRLDPNVVAVAPFNVLSPDLALWKEGLVDVLARNLDGAGPIRTVSPSVVVQGWTGHGDRQSADSLARRTGAGLAIFGTLEKFGGDSVRAAVTMIDANSGALLSDFRRSDQINRMDRLVDSVTVAILREMGRTRPISGVRLAGVGSSSLPALKAFLQGEQYFRRTVFDSATASYEQAVALDSNFALALYRAGTVRGWMNGIRDTVAASLVSRAGSHLRGVGARDSLIILSDSLGRSIALGNENVVVNPGLPERVRRLFEITDVLAERYPGDPDAWYAIGEARFHHGTRLGRRQSPRSILEAFDRSIAADSGFAPAYIHAIDLAFQLGDVQDGLRYLRAYNALASTDLYAQSMRLLERVIDPALAGTPETQAMLDTASAATLQIASIAAWRATDSTEAALRLVQEGMERTGGFRLGITPLSTRSAEVDQLSYRGHIREARRQVANAPAILGARGSISVLVDAAWFHLWPDDTLRALAAQAPDTQPAMAALLAIALHDPARMAATKPRLQERAAAGGARAIDILSMFDAVEALQRADTTAALHALDTIGLADDDEATARLLRAELLNAQGKTAQALDAVRDGAWCVCAARVMMSLIRGRLAEAVGEKALAIESYGLVARAWRKADPELQRYVEEARTGLKRLGADERAVLRL